MDIKLDETDLYILELLQENGRIRQSELASIIKLSEPSLSDRLRKLEEKKIIEKYFAKINAKLLGKDITAFIEVKVDSSKHYPNFIKQVNASEEILECHAVTGNASHLLKVRTDNTNSLERLLAKIQTWSGITQTMTSVVLSTTKETMKVSVHTNSRQ